MICEVRNRGVPRSAPDVRPAKRCKMHSEDDYRSLQSVLDKTTSAATWRTRIITSNPILQSVLSCNQSSLACSPTAFQYLTAGHSPRKMQITNLIFHSLCRFAETLFPMPARRDGPAPN